MPYVRQRKPAVPPANAANSPLAHTVLPQRVVQKPPPPKVPFPTMADHQSSIVLTIPTFGPLPPVSRTVAPTVVSSSTHGTVVSKPSAPSVVPTVKPHSHAHRHRTGPAHR